MINVFGQPELQKKILLVEIGCPARNARVNGFAWTLVDKIPAHQSPILCAIHNALMCYRLASPRHRTRAEYDAALQGLGHIQIIERQSGRRSAL